ncbi:mandelate racemase/muconate lactonizing enzyme family protein, partial [Chloroflexota bacterium]
MKIADLKTFVVGVPPPGRGGRNWVFVKLTTDDGVEGFGEAFGVPIDPHITAELIESIGERWVIGTDPFAIELMWRKIYASGYDQHPDVIKMSVISALEIACWDIIGKAVGQPVYNLLGGRYHEGLRSYTYLYPGSSQPGMSGVQSSPQQAGERALEYVKRGFTA